MLHAMDQQYLVRIDERVLLWPAVLRRTLVLKRRAFYIYTVDVGFLDTSKCASFYNIWIAGFN